MLKYKDKDLEDLGLEETIEFEKSLLKKVLAANTAGMSDQIIDQLNGFLSIVRMHKQEKIGQLIQSHMPKDNFDDNGSLIIGEIEPEQPDDFE